MEVATPTMPYLTHLSKERYGDSGRSTTIITAEVGGESRLYPSPWPRKAAKSRRLLFFPTAAGESSGIVAGKTSYRCGILRRPVGRKRHDRARLKVARRSRISQWSPHRPASAGSSVGNRRPGQSRRHTQCERMGKIHLPPGSMARRRPTAVCNGTSPAIGELRQLFAASCGLTGLPLRSS